MRIDLDNLKKAAEEFDSEIKNLYLARGKLEGWYAKCIQPLLEDGGCKDQFAEIIRDDISGPIDRIYNILHGKQFKRK